MLENEKSVIHGRSLLDYVYKIYSKSKKARRKLEDITWDEFVSAVDEGVVKMLYMNAKDLADVEPSARQLGKLTMQYEYLALLKNANRQRTA